jgi:DNA repair protein RecN (Recombination protein N)
MLQSLRIENFALIDYLELKLESGLNVLTGETGAGKSIILDAIDAALGGKVNNRAVRTGEDRALVEATFQLDPPVAEWLATQQIESLDEKSLVCSREITTSQSSQRSRSRLNGVVVNKQQMESIRDQLVEITAQGQTVQIGQPMMQREWLDSFGGETLLHQRANVATTFAAYQQAQQALEKRRQSEQQRLQQLDLFEYQLRELNTANLSDPDELNQLEQERKRLSHSVELQQQSYQVYQALYQNDGDGAACADLLGKAEAALSGMLEYDEQLQPILDLVSSALAQVEEAGRQVNAYGESLETDPQRLQEVQERIGDLKQICRKYGPTLTEAIALQQQLQANLAGLNGDGQSLEALEQAFQQRQQALTTACAHLTQLRQTTARSLEARLIEELKPLAMEKVKFQVEISPISANASGADQITFLFSPNPGEPLQPLREIASGGEMSRFLLALQACFSQVDSVGTLVFDEIDVGVSGRVAQAIAEKLYQLGQRHQVLCVTHQPIIAAMADHHFRVSKQVIDSGNGRVSADGERLAIAPTQKKSKGKSEEGEVALSLAAGETPDLRTVVRIVPLAIEQRREELAQLAGGQSAQEAIAFADSLLAQAATLRQNQKPPPCDVAPTDPPTEPSPPPKARRAKTNKKA